MSAQPSHADLREDLRHLIGRIDGLVSAVASVETKVEAHGAHAITQFDVVNSRLEVIEGKVLTYDLLKARVLGAIVAGGVALGALWWLVKDKIAHFFGVST